MPDPQPFISFAPRIRPASALRTAITAMTRLPERKAVARLLEAVAGTAPARAAAGATARMLVKRLRTKPARSGVQALVQEYSLSSQEGVALMCLAEALLRIPDDATRDALIRDKIAGGDWSAHIGDGRSLFVNAATWGLVLTGKLVASADDRGLSAALVRIVARLGEPVIRRSIDVAMRMMGEQFVAGETIDEALDRAGRLEAQGFGYSYDMLGEAAMTARDATRYRADYERAIHAIGKASAGRGVYAGPGISIKLSALHPRYARAQAERVMSELLPRVRDLALLARTYDIGFNIDAEEADRLELSLELLQSLAEDPSLGGWDGLGFVVQAYGKRAPAVIDFLIALARDTGRRIMVRLVKGAYWDAEIKRAQEAGLSDFPVFTRKLHTDLSYIACATQLLAARDAVFPQFATHNAQTLATIHQLAGPDFQIGDYEFQCLHGMGEPLYAEVVGADGLDRPCRIYAPVGSHETLLAYLVRRLLENGANSSFVNRIGDPDVSVDALIADPVQEIRAMADPGSPHPAIALPGAILGERRNSVGLDLADDGILASLGETLVRSATRKWQARPEIVGLASERPAQDVLNPAERNDIVGTVVFALPRDIALAASVAASATTTWSAVPAVERAAILERAADAMQAEMPTLMGIVIREAGKSAANAVSEVREAIDFLRYYAAEARSRLSGDQQSLGPVVCISPWNFPLAIFTGQIAAALAAGNPVLGKPAEETPLIAAQAVRILHEAGVPSKALQLIPGAGDIGAALVAAAETAAVMFTGSTEVARAIQRQLAARTLPDGQPIPLIAETGGQNAMVVDSSALTEQVVADVIASAFDSAGQRCSALRLLCLQEEVAERTLAMLKGTMEELQVGRPDYLCTDIGPVITEEARTGILAHIEAMRAAGRSVHQTVLDPETVDGNFVPPTLIELGAIADLKREVFGPVLHVVRYRTEELDSVIDQINATGYALTFGLHTRLETTIERVSRRIEAGNIYINRNIIGAVVGVQPFGGHGLSGTGPKAGGPLYLTRLVRGPMLAECTTMQAPVDEALSDWLTRRHPEAASAVRNMAKSLPLCCEAVLPGPVGERNLYSRRPRGKVAALPRTESGLLRQVGAALITGNRVVVSDLQPHREWLKTAPEVVIAAIEWSWDPLAEPQISSVLIEDPADVAPAAFKILDRSDIIVALHLETPAGYAPVGLVEEVATSINTAAAGGNASLMTIA